MINLLRTLQTCKIIWMTIAASSGLGAPRYTSPWFEMNSNTPITDTYYRHDFGVDPAMADVQVRSSSGFIFPSIGSGQVDNDNSDYVRGGVFCTYNKTVVWLYGARTKYSSMSDIISYIVYTGQSWWIGDNKEQYSSASVRVRLWHPDDLPPPSFIVPSFIMDSTVVYAEVAHSLASLPSLTTVQLENGGVIAEGQGTDSHLSDASGSNWGGLVYGVNSTHVRVWVPLPNSLNGLFNRCDGWGDTDSGGSCGSSRTWPSATIIIKMWHESVVSPAQTTTVQHSTLAAEDIGAHELSVMFFNVDTDYIEVSSEPTASDNYGFHFKAWGAAMSDGLNGVSGLVFAYSDVTQSVRLWHPAYISSYDRCIVRISSQFGDTANNVCRETVNAHVRIWKGEQCPYVTDVPNNTVMLTNTSYYIAFACVNESILLSGNLTQHCVSGSWTGSQPICSAPCSFITSVPNYAVVTLNTTLLVNFSCIQDSYLMSGNLTLACENSNWVGTLPACSEPCDYFTPTPDNTLVVGNTTTNIHFTCVETGHLTSGNLSLYCENGSWVGSPPVCKICSNIDGGVNAVLDLMALQYNRINYTCLLGYQHVSGNLSRDCVITGDDVAWTGDPPVCELPLTTPATTSTVTTTATPSTSTSSTSTSSTTSSTSTSTTTSSTSTSITTSSTSTTAPTTSATTASTPPQTTPVSTTTPSSCPVCPLSQPNILCVNTTITLEIIAEAEKKAEEIVANLTIPTKTTSKFLRSLTSAKDERSSSLYIGMVGSLVFGLVFGVILLLDLMSALGHILCRRKNTT